VPEGQGGALSEPLGSNIGRLRLAALFGQRFIIFQFLVSAPPAFGRCSKQNFQNSKPQLAPAAAGLLGPKNTVRQQFGAKKGFSAFYVV